MENAFYVEDYPDDVVDFAYNWSANRVANPAKEKDAIAYFEEAVDAIVGLSTRAAAFLTWAAAKAPIDCRRSDRGHSERLQFYLYN